MNETKLPNLTTAADLKIKTLYQCDLITERFFVHQVLGPNILSVLFVVHKLYIQQIQQFKTF